MKLRIPSVLAVLAPFAFSLVLSVGSGAQVMHDFSQAFSVGDTAPIKSAFDVTPDERFVVFLIQAPVPIGSAEVKVMDSLTGAILDTKPIPGQLSFLSLIHI